MATILLKFFLLYNLLNSFLLSLIPKKLRSLWPPHTCTHHTNPTLNSNPLTSPPPPPPSFHSHKRSSMDSTEIYNVFQVFDRNGDGLITKEELNDSLQNMGIFIPPSDLSLMIQKIDANGDGCVDVAEFRDLHRSIMEERDDGGGDDQEEEMKEAFAVFDRNGDGFITGDELRSVLESLGVKQGRTLEDCKRMIKKVDVDGDGRVNFVEFKKMMKGDGISALS